MSSWMLEEDFCRELSVCFQLSLSPSALPMEEGWGAIAPHIKNYTCSLELGGLASDSHLINLKDKRPCTYSDGSLKRA